MRQAFPRQAGKRICSLAALLVVLLGLGVSATAARSSAKVSLYLLESAAGCGARYTVDWGDRSGGSSGAAPSGDVHVDHTYPAGTYTLTLTMTYPKPSYNRCYYVNALNRINESMRPTSSTPPSAVPRLATS